MNTIRSQGAEEQGHKGIKSGTEDFPRLRGASPLYSVALLFLLLFGLACRFYGLNWDEGVQLHPDERFYVSTLFERQIPASWRLYFDSSVSPFNPSNTGAFFVYGQLPLLFGKAWVALWRAPGPVEAFVPLRMLSGLFDAGTVLLTVALARRILPLNWALWAGSAIALAAMHVQASHFFTSDTFALFFGVLSFYLGSRFTDAGRPGWLVGAGAALGLALACKVSALFFALPLLVFVLVVMWKTRRARTVLAFGAAILVALLAFRLGHPMAFRGEWPGVLALFDLRFDSRFLGALAQQAAITRGDVDVPFNVQWIGRRDYLFPLQNLALWGVGWGVLLSAGAGMLAFLWQWRQKSLDAREKLILSASLLFCLALFGVQGATFSKFTRYFLPLTPFLALFGAFFWARIAQQRSGARWLALGVVVGTALWCTAVTSIYGRRHPRLVASQWLINNIPPGTPVANETSWDENLPLGTAHNGGLEYLKFETYDEDTFTKRERMLQILNRAEWIFVSSGRSWQNIPRWPQKWPLTTEFYYALEDGRLGFEKAREFTSYPRFGPFAFPDDGIEEALSVYDHPRVILWKKRPDYSPQQTQRVLEAVPLPQPQPWTPKLAGDS